MTDYFALLDQPHQPWIDLAKLEEKYRELAGITHPDRAMKSSHDFVEVNEAYRTLREPEARLRHLLTLEGKPPVSSIAETPPDLSNLFMKIAPAMTSRDKGEINDLTKELSDYYDDALEHLHQLNDAWNDRPGSALRAVEELHRRFVFLSRWKDLVEQHNFDIANNPSH